MENKNNFIGNLLVALFYSPGGYISDLLNKNIKNTMVIYLQEYIKTNFLDPLRALKKISNTAMETIRNLSKQNGWNNGGDAGVDITNYYKFLMTVLENPKIQIGNDKFEHFMEFTVKESVTVKQLVSGWVTGHPIVNIPIIIAIKINRENPDVKIDIQKKIVPIKTDMLNSEWFIYSIICMSGGHHYVLVDLKFENKWLSFDDMANPYMKEIRVVELAEKIQRECVFLIYKLG